MIVAIARRGPVLVVLTLTAAVSTAAEPGAPDVLTPRWAHEVPGMADDRACGAEHNPTGNPIGGGKGYSDIRTAGDFTACTLAELTAALKRARAGQVVYIPDDAKIDFGGTRRVPIPAGVTLAGSRGANGSPGGLLFSDVLARHELLGTAGDNVRVTGLRMRGPYPLRKATEVRGGGVRTRHARLVVDNCELSGFSYYAVGAFPGAKRLYVHHNHIHHNQRAGLGYGVVIYGAEALVEANRFDWCRHFIAGSGAKGEGYEARYNICGPNVNGHMLDMHGGRDRKDGTDLAAEWLDIHHNTFLGDAYYGAIGIRGFPRRGARIHHNWFHNPYVTTIWCISPISESNAVNFAMRRVSPAWFAGHPCASDNVYGPGRKAFTDRERASLARSTLLGRVRKLSREQMVDVVRRQEAKLAALGLAAGRSPPMATGLNIDKLARLVVEQAERLDARARRPSP